MTLYHVRVAYHDNMFDRAFDSMIGRSLFVIDAGKIGARVVDEWIAAAPDVAPANEQIVTAATADWLRSAS